MSANNLKSTQQRFDIAETFFKIDSHISLDEMLLKVKKKNRNVGYATVYRTMKLLKDCDLAIERQFADGQTRYENIPEGGHHDHIICLKCSRIEEFQNQQIEDLQDSIADKYGFELVNHKLELYGYCKDCRKQG